MLEKHGCPVKALKSELYYSSTLYQVVFQVLHYANLIVAHAPTVWARTNTHLYTYTHHPSIHLLLSSENTKEVRRCRPFRLVLRCWWSGLTETLVVVKPLLMKCLVAVLTLDGLCGEVTLSLMVGQTCLIPSLKRAARMVAV